MRDCRDTQKRIARKAAELGNAPYDARVSGTLTQKGRLRKSRIGGWRLIYTVDEEAKIVSIVAIERRGQVYKRL